MLRSTRCFKLKALSASLLLSGLGIDANADVLKCYETPERSYCAVNLSPALQLQTGIDAVKESHQPWRLEISGNVRLVSTGMNLPLSDTSLVMEFDDDSGEMTEFYGTAKLPLDQWQPLQDAQLTAEPPMAVIGLFQAETIEEMFDGELPLNTAEAVDGSKRESPQPYLLFHTSSGGLSIDLNQAFELGMSDKSSFALDIADSQSITFAIDVVDPYVFSGQGYSASLTVNRNEQGQPKIEQAETYSVVSYQTTDAHDDVEREIVEYYDEDGKLVSKFIHDPGSGSLVRHDINDKGEVTASFYQRDEQGDFVREGSDKSSGDYFNLVELDNGVDVSQAGRQRMTGYRSSSYQVTASDGSVSKEIHEYHDNKGRLVNKFIFDPATGGMVKQDFDAEGRMTVSFYQQDGAGDFVREGRDKHSGDYFNAAELAAGTDVNDNDRPRDTDSSGNSEQDNKKRRKFDLGIDAFAFSYNGWIPFEAQNTFGVPEASRNFSGQLYMKGAVTFDGTLVLDGETTTYIGEHGFMMGGNGDLAFTLPGLPDAIDFSLYLGSASAAFQISPDKQMTYLSGVLEPDTKMFEGLLPLSAAGKVQAVGYIDNKLGDANITLQGSFNLGAAMIGKLIGVDLQNLTSIDGYASVDSGGVVVQGVTSSQIHPAVAFSGAIGVEAEFSWSDPEDFYLRLTGNADVHGVGLERVSLEINASGLFINGSFVTPLTEIAMFGSIGTQGPSLSGYGTVSLGLGGVTKAMQDAAAAIADAQSEVDRLSNEISRQRSVVQDERNAHASKLSQARSHLATGQHKVNGLNGSISAEYRMIAQRKAQISSWYSWYKKAKWYQKAGRYARYLAEKAWRNADIGRRYVNIGAYKVALTAANLALEAAKTSLYGLEQATVLTPIDLDPRVAGLIAAKEVANGVLEAAKAPFKNVPLIDHDFEGRIDARLDRHGMSGSVTASFDGYQALQGELEFVPKPRACIEIPTMGKACTSI